MDCLAQEAVTGMRGPECQLTHPREPLRLWFSKRLVFVSCLVCGWEHHRLLLTRALRYFKMRHNWSWPVWKSLHFLTFGLLTRGGLVWSTEVKQSHLRLKLESLRFFQNSLDLSFSPLVKNGRSFIKMFLKASIPHCARSQDGCCYIVQEMSTHLRADALGELGTSSWSRTLSPDIFRCEYYILPSPFWIA